MSYMVWLWSPFWQRLCYCCRYSITLEGSKNWSMFCFNLILCSWSVLICYPLPLPMAVHVTKQKPKSKEKKKQSLIFVFIILTFFLQFHEKKKICLPNTFYFISTYTTLPCYSRYSVSYNCGLGHRKAVLWKWTVRNPLIICGHIIRMFSG